METITPEHVEMRPMEKLIRFLKGLHYDNFYGCVIIKFENGKATHVELNSTRKWQYKDLPDEYEDDNFGNKKDFHINRQLASQ